MHVPTIKVNAHTALWKSHDLSFLYALNESTNTLCMQKRNKLVSLIPQIHFFLVWGCCRGQRLMLILQTSQCWDLKRGFLLPVCVGVSKHQEWSESGKHRGTHGNSHTTLVLNDLSDMVWARHKQGHIFHACWHTYILCTCSERNGGAKPQEHFLQNSEEHGADTAEGYPKHPQKPGHFKNLLISLWVRFPLPDF